MTDDNKDLPEQPTPELGEDTTAEVAIDTTAQPDPDAAPDLTSAFGPMDSIDVNSVDFAVMVMCWNLSSNKTLGDRQLVNIANDDEALDIIKNEGIAVPMKNEDDLWSVGMGFQNETSGKIVTRIQIADESLRLLAVRALHVKYTRCDPAVGAVINRFFYMVQAQQAAEKAVKH